MLNPKFIKENREEVIKKLEVKNLEETSHIDQVIHLYDEQNDLKIKIDNNLYELSKLSQKIGELHKDGAIKEANQLKKGTSELKEKNKILNIQLKDVKEGLHELLTQIPNLPHSSVPKGNGEEDNEEVFKQGDIPVLHKGALPHWELAKKFNLIDFEIGVKITGAGFPLYIGKGAILQRALINFFLSEATKAGYTEVMPPIMVNEASAYGTGQLPDKEGQMYGVPDDKLYLIPTAEVPLTNIYRDMIIDNKNLPIKLAGYTPCFRREAGSYGKDVRGLNRLHQFDKVEIVRIEKPENSYQALEEMIAYVRNIVEKLELPYRVLRLCGGDLGFTSALTYDFEVYSSAQQKWLEVSSISNFETYQSNRLRIRHRPEGEKKAKLVHTLNGSALALPRILAALLENNQTETGINIPRALKPFVGFDGIG